MTDRTTSSLPVVHGRGCPRVAVWASAVLGYLVLVGCSATNTGTSTSPTRMIVGSTVAASDSDAAHAAYQACLKQHGGALTTAIPRPGTSMGQGRGSANQIARQVCAGLRPGLSGHLAGSSSPSPSR